MCLARSEPFSFLGYTIGQYRSRTTGRAYIGTLPSRKSGSSICRKITDLTSRRTLWKSFPDLVSAPNRMLVGWANYLSMGAVDRVYGRIDQHVRYRLRRWLRKKHKHRTSVYRRWPAEFFEQAGLVDLVARRRGLSCANV